MSSDPQSAAAPFNPAPARIELFGGLRLHVLGRTVTRFPTRKTAALLAYLALYPEKEHAREVLVDLFWPESEPGAGKKSLSVALSAIRRELEPPGIPDGGVLHTDHFTARIVPGAAITDVEEFRRSLAAASHPPGDEGRAALLERAVSLYGDLLPGVSEDWVSREQERLQDQVLRALDELVRLREEGGDLEAALAAARRAVELDPYREEAHRELMRLHARMGQLPAALRHFQGLERLLREELETEPSPETRALVRSLGERSHVPLAPPGPPPSEPVTAARREPAPEEAPRGNLARAVTRFIGREEELAQVRALLREHRLLTLTGAGGVGKTRLALEAAGGLGARYPDGAWLVDLAALKEPELVAQAAAAALGVRGEPGRAAADSLTEHLRNRRALLLLDNCEHLLDASARLADILVRGCPGVTVLATSRELLGVGGEAVYRVPNLQVPEEGAGAPERWEEYSAVALFCDRVRLHQPGFTLTGRNAAAVAQICRRLDGQPLPIELAAARARTLGPEQLAARLDDRFRLLTSGSRTALPRQQTLRALVDWSYELLDEPERRLFRTLAVFSGAWTLEALEAVASGQGDALDLLLRLVDRSLVVHEPESGRYRLLETLRLYAAERLAEDPAEREEARRRHAHQYLDVARRLDARRNSPEEAAAWTEMERDLDNLRAGLHWAAEHDDTTLAEYAKAMHAFFWRRGYWRERREWTERGLAAARRVYGERDNEVARLKHSLGFAYQDEGNLEAAERWYLEALDTARALGYARGVAVSLNNLGNLALDQGRAGDAERWYREALDLLRASAGPSEVAVALNNLGHARAAVGTPEEARALYEESLALAREAGDLRAVSLALTSLGSVAFHAGRIAEARTLHQEALDVSRELQNDRQAAFALSGLGEVAAAEGDLRRAREYYGEALRLRNEFGDRLNAAETLASLGLVAAKEKNWEEGAVLLFRGERILSSLGSRLATRVQADLETLRSDSGADEALWERWRRAAEREPGVV